MWKKGDIRRMFSAIAPRYDRLNRVLSFNMDPGWRRRLVERARPTPGERVLDLCAGTADICVEFCRSPAGAVVGVDFSPGMLARAKAKLAGLGLASRVRLVEADVLSLPFAPGCFDIVSIGFGLRNLLDYARGLEAMREALRPGGKLLILEAIAPSRSVFGRLYRFHLMFILPAIAAVFGDRISGYRYFSSSVSGFVGPSEIIRWLEAAGFVNIRSERLSAGIACLFYCEKPRQ